MLLIIAAAILGGAILALAGFLLFGRSTASSATPTAGVVAVPRNDTRDGRAHGRRHGYPRRGDRQRAIGGSGDRARDCSRRHRNERGGQRRSGSNAAIGNTDCTANACPGYPPRRRSSSRSCCHRQRNRRSCCHPNRPWLPFRPCSHRTAFHPARAGRPITHRPLAPQPTPVPVSAPAPTCRQRYRPFHLRLRRRAPPQPAPTQPPQPAPTQPPASGAKPVPTTPPGFVPPYVQRPIKTPIGG